MQRRLNYLPFFVLACMVGLGVVGCTQSEDVVTPVGTTEVTLTAERLPALPSGMIYQLWVANSDDTVSLGRFQWDPTNKEFTDSADQVISSTFVLKGDVYSYSSMFVSVEQFPGDNGDHPGPIMLIDVVGGSGVSEPRMRFPQSDSLWQTLVYFNIEATTDQSQSAHDGYGIWFTRYAVQNYTKPDTTGVRAETTYVEDSVIAPGTTVRIPSQLDSIWLETTYVTLPTNFLYRSASPLRHIGIHFWLGYETITVGAEDTSYHWQGNVIKLSFPWVTQHADPQDVFSVDGCILPNIQKWGWKYQGWVLTPYLSNAAVTMKSKWRLTPPAWPYKLGGVNYIAADTGVLFTTGQFDSLGGPDSGDPFVLSGRRRPDLPGEDFLNATALDSAFGLNSVNFLPLGSGNVGCVLLTLEPNNDVSDTTNFPLIVAIGDLPAARGADNFFNMRPWVRELKGDMYGFPVVYTQLKRI